MLCSANKTIPLLTYQPLLLAQAQTALLSMASQRMMRVVTQSPAQAMLTATMITHGLTIDNKATCTSSNG
jgi:hypothetical protein